MESSYDSMSSPLDNFLNYVPKENAFRQPLYNALAFSAVSVVAVASYYVLVVLGPFLMPIFWAVLTGFVLHPYKSILTSWLRSYLSRSVEDESVVAVQCLKAVFKSLDYYAETVGDYILLKKVKVIFCGILLVPVSLFLYYYSPSVLGALFKTFTFLWGIVDSISAYHLMTLMTVYVVALAFSPENYVLALKSYSCVFWCFVGFYALNSLWPPLFYVAVFFLGSMFYFGMKSSGSSQDSTKTDAGPAESVSSTVYNLLKSFTSSRGTKTTNTKEPIILTEYHDDNDAGGIEDEKVTTTVTTTTTTNTVSVPPKFESTPTPSALEAKVSSSRYLDTPILQHPGVSALRRGGLISRSGVPRTGFRHHNRTPLIRRDTIMEEGYESASYLYICWVFWACCIIQLWLHPVLLHLLPLPVIYFALKRIILYFDIASILREKWADIFDRIQKWTEERKDILIPFPIRYLGQTYYKAERKALLFLPENVDSIVTCFLLLSLIVVLFITGIFVSFQLYYEVLHIMHTSGDVVARFSNSTVFEGMPVSADYYENVMESAYQQGRTYLSSFIKQYDLTSDNEQLEAEVLKLFDRTFQYWLDSAGKSNTQFGPKVDGEALSSSVDDIVARIKENFNFSSLSQFAKDNMGTLTSIMEHTWTLVKGNAGFIMNLLIDLLSVLLQSGSGFVNFVFSIIVYFTALFYLLLYSGPVYKPVAVLSELGIFGDGFAAALNKAVNSVFILTVKMATFYGLWTYLTHTIFNASIVMVPVLAATFLAAVPVAGQYLVALPAALELWLAADRVTAAVCLVVCHILPMCLVDTVIYSEIKRGIHPWITGLSIVGGTYCFGIPGAIYGPLLVCAVYVVLTMYTGFFTADIPQNDTMAGHKSMLTPNVKKSNETVM